MKTIKEVKEYLKDYPHFIKQGIDLDNDASYMELQMMCELFQWLEEEAGHSLKFKHLPKKMSNYKFR